MVPTAMYTSASCRKTSTGDTDISSSQSAMVHYTSEQPKQEMPIRERDENGEQ